VNNASTSTVYLILQCSQVILSIHHFQFISIDNIRY
jgi:hypothetical protein